MARPTRQITQQTSKAEVLHDVVHYPGYGFYARFGPKLADWEPVEPEAYFGADIDPYEIDQYLGRI